MLSFYAALAFDMCFRHQLEHLKDIDHTLIMAVALCGASCTYLKVSYISTWQPVLLLSMCAHHTELLERVGLLCVVLTYRNLITDF